MSRWPCKDKQCVAMLPPTLVTSVEGRFHYAYCQTCRHVVWCKQLPSTVPPRGPKGGLRIGAA